MCIRDSPPTGASGAPEAPVMGVQGGGSPPQRRRSRRRRQPGGSGAVSYTHLRAHETSAHL
eukprot:13629512-Alexandrium_andersonii.AAC.1